MLYQKSRFKESPLERKQKRREISGNLSDEKLISMCSKNLSVSDIVQYSGLTPSETGNKINRLIKKGRILWYRELIPEKLYETIKQEVLRHNTTSIKRLSKYLEGRAERYQIKLVITHLRMSYEQENS